MDSDQIIEIKAHATWMVILSVVQTTVLGVFAMIASTRTAPSDVRQELLVQTASVQKQLSDIEAKVAGNREILEVRAHSGEAITKTLASIALKLADDSVAINQGE